jgi:hypothetical protein
VVATHIFLGNVQNVEGDKYFVRISARIVRGVIFTRAERASHVPRVQLHVAFAADVLFGYAGIVLPIPFPLHFELPGFLFSCYTVNFYFFLVLFLCRLFVF